MSIRRRHTFFFDFADADAFEKFDFDDTLHSVTISHFESPCEDRIQIPFSVLSKNEKAADIVNLLKSIEKIQIKWSKGVPFSRNYPATIVHEPGLHVEFVSKPDTDIDSNAIKALLAKFFGVDFSGNESFVDTPKWKSFYTPLDSISTFTSALQESFCATSDTQCFDQIEELNFADSFSFSYGTTPDNARAHHQSSDVTIETFWADRSAMAKKLNLSHSVISKIYPNETDERVEIGILSVHPEYTTPYSIWGMAGFTRNLNEAKSEKLLYQYTTKHRSIDSNYNVDFLRPVGLHPKHRIHMSNIKAPRQQCSLFAKYSFSKSLFLDRYQLKDLSEPTPNRPAIGQLYDVWGETDLEAPIWAVDGWGSEALIQIFTSHKERNDDLVFDLPTHSRYEVPQENASFVHEYQPWPVVFWACLPSTEPDEGETLESKIPAAIETRNIGYESIFPKSTVFYYLNPQVPQEFSSPKLYSEFDIPVAPFSAYSTVQIGTVVVILLFFFYLLYEIFRNYFTFNKKLAVKNDKKTK